MFIGGRYTLTQYMLLDQKNNQKEQNIYKYCITSKKK